MKLKKYLATGLSLGIIIGNLPLYSFANGLENKYYNELSNIETKEDLQKSVQRAVRAGEVDSWIEGLVSMPTSRSALTSAVVDGKIYCIGGFNTSSTLNKVEVYDPETDSWEIKSSMPTSRYIFASSVVDGKIYCIGGFNGSSPLNKVEVYDPETDSWEIKTSMSTARYGLTSSVVDGKIYCIGGYDGSSLNIVEVYDPETDSWEIKTSMSTARYGLTSSVVDGKIYCIGGYDGSSLNIVEVYDPETDSWKTKTSMPTSRYYLTSGVVDGKMYCIGGYNSSYLNIVEVYDPITDSWKTKTSMPTNRSRLISAVVEGKIYCIGGSNGSYLNKVEVYIATETTEQKATSSVTNAESTKDPIDIETARNLVNQLPDGDSKTQLQARLDAISPNISLERKNATSNLDLYVKCENMILMSLDTNSITFDDFSGVTDMEKANAINITVTSSLPYQLNAYLPTEIQSPDKLNTMAKAILNIKENSELTYQTFANTVDKIVLKDNCIAGNNIIHGIDIKLKGGIAHEKDVYKTTIKFEVQQK